MKTSVTFNVRATGPGLTLIATIDEQEIYRGEPGAEVVQVCGDFDDSTECQRLLSIKMQGKLPEHTKVSESGEILEDRVIEISDLCFDGIPLGYVTTQVSTYTHDLNGTATQQQHKFYGVMGCNGEVKISFSTPVYFWLLENM